MLAQNASLSSLSPTRPTSHRLEGHRLARRAVPRCDGLCDTCGFPRSRATMRILTD